MPRIIIIDDEAHARSCLRKMLAQYCPKAKVIGEADSVTAGISLILKKKPEAIFLDIQMKDGTGFDLLGHFPRPDFDIIFTTAFDQFAVKAFKFNALDYLVKPINPNELCRSISKAQAKRDRQLYFEQLSQLIEMTHNRNPKKIAISTSEGLILLKLKELTRLKSSGSYTTFFTRDGKKVMVARTLKKFEEILPTDTFFRPHQSHIVNLNFVQGILREDGGYALMEDGTRIPISGRKREEFLGLLAGSSL